MKTLTTTLVAMLVCLLFWAGNAMASQMKVVGTVMRNGDNYAVLTNHTEYLVEAKNLSNMIGDTVAASGDVFNGREVSTIQIDSLHVVANKDLITPKLKNGKSMS